MSQQVNLYRAQFPQAKPINVSNKWSTIAIAAALIVFTGAGYGLWKIESLKKQFEIELSSKQIAEKSVNRLKKALMESADDDRSKLALIELKEQVKRKQAIADRLKQEDNLVPVSFAKRFEAIARQDVKGVWFREIQIEDYGHHVTLVGETTEPKQLTRYLQQLGKEPTFSGVSFAVFDVGGPDSIQSEEEGVVGFVVSTHELPSQLDIALRELNGR